VRSRLLSLLWCLGLIALPVIGCGGDGGGKSSNGGTVPTGNEGPAPKIAGDADPGDVRVIDAWVTALRRGDVDAAARYFAIPSVAENGPLLLHIESLDDARRFNESLPCGALLVRAETQGQFTTATFRLTERPGPGICGPGTGGAAKTSFVIRDGKIVQWRRVGTGGGGQGAPSQSA
jgi:limonene-1,2-epoxide hydrolase